ncbi:MAG TPA: response regulator [Dongiaceae bacterium]|nr:response regulator [Dongiaceae bacterium]
MRILLADDQKEIRLLAVSQLQRDGHSVVALSDGPEVLAEFNRGGFDMLLLDESMPTMSGVDVLHAVRATEKGKRQIIVAVTGYNTEQDRRRLTREGFDGVIGKPFRLDRLDATLREIVSSRALPGADVSRQPIPSQAATFQGILQSVGGDSKLLLHMIRAFLRETPKRLTLMESAVRLKRADKLASIAHALKGSVAIFGAAAAQQLCQELQEQGRKNEISDAARAFDLLKEEIAKLEANLRGYAGQITPSATRRNKPKSAGSAARRKPR